MENNNAKYHRSSLPQPADRAIYHDGALSVPRKGVDEQKKSEKELDFSDCV